MTNSRIGRINDSKTIVCKTNVQSPFVELLRDTRSGVKSILK